MGQNKNNPQPESGFIEIVSALISVCLEIVQTNQKLLLELSQKLQISVLSY